MTAFLVSNTAVTGLNSNCCSGNLLLYLLFEIEVLNHAVTQKE